MQNKLWLSILFMTSSVVFGAMPAAGGGLVAVHAAKGSTSLDTLLLHSARDGNLTKVIQFLRLGANPNARNYEMVTPLMFAAESGDPRILHALIRNGARDSRDIRGETPLMYAVQHEEERVVKYLLSVGADKNVKNNRGNTALDLARNLEDATFCRLLDGSKEESDFYPELLIG